MRNLVFLLEEKSAEECLKNVVGRLLEGRDDVQPYYIPFEGKCDLERKVERKMRHWNLPDSSFIILRDQDADDCLNLKTRLVALCKQSGKNAYQVRIACRELETFYLGDLAAVKEAYPACRETQETRKFRNPDALGTPAEELRKITKGEYRKISGSREISRYLKLDGSNRSASFNILLSAIRKAISLD